MFSPEQFLDMQITDSNSTQAVPVPVGEYIGLVDKVDITSWQKKDDPSVSGLKLSMMWSIEDEAVKELLARQKVTVKHEIMLDITESGGLDMGKGRNVGLGRLREALDLNKPGAPFSFAMLTGRMAKIAVAHRLDKNNPDNVYPEVKAVARMA